MKIANPSQNFTSLAELFGPETVNVTIEDLLGMKSGIPDYDTASPSGKMPTDLLRQTAYDHPTDSYTPSEMLNLPWCRKGHLLFPPGVCDKAKYGNCYTSTNFVLLGMVLANQVGSFDHVNNALQLAKFIQACANPCFDARSHLLYHSPLRIASNASG
jgi:hypothetical protein